MLRNRKIKGSIRDLKEAITASDDARIEKHARAILEYDFGSDPQSEALSDEEVRKAALATASAALTRVFLKQARYADAMSVLEHDLVAWHDIISSNSVEKQTVLANFAVLVSEAKSAMKDKRTSQSKEFSDLMRVVEAIESFSKRAPGKTSGGKTATDTTTKTTPWPLVGSARNDETETADPSAAGFVINSGPPIALPIPPIDEETGDKMRLRFEQITVQRYCEQGRDEEAKESSQYYAGKGLHILQGAEAIRDAAELMIHDLVEHGLTWTKARDSGKEEELQAAYAEFARNPQAHPAIVEKFKQAEDIYRQGLGFLAQAPGYDSNNFAWWCAGLAGLLKTAGKFDEATEVEEHMSSL